ncbi:hypothetical protein HCUR_00192 [Holospora curviuscula]|uniref:Uncharacterized protein n=1 Tax=Holospora curviuscula TaxID=1082868 RepID=A0A2S5RE75_9PROT|nr:hypothetical protein HCUR_00192 [Holospora curviuscula]
MAYTFAKRLKAIKGKTPWQFILNQWTIHPEYFTINPNHFLAGLNNCIGHENTAENLDILPK